MAALPANSTARLWIDYISKGSGTEHTMQFRYAGTDPVATSAQQSVLNMLQAIGAAQFVTGWKILRCRTCLAGGSFSLPQTLISGLASFIGTGSVTGYTGVEEAGEWTVQGRSRTTGRRVDLSLYGIVNANVPTTTGRWVGGSTGAPTWVSALVTSLNGLTNPFLVIDGTTPAWYNYVNYGRNSYWERRIRIN